MKCPHCGKTFAAPISRTTHIQGAPVILLACPHCGIMVGAVNGRT